MDRYSQRKRIDITSDVNFEGHGSNQIRYRRAKTCHDSLDSKNVAIVHLGVRQSDHKEGGVVRVRSVNGSNDLDSFDNTQQLQQTDMLAFKKGKRKRKVWRYVGLCLMC